MTIYERAARDRAEGKLWKARDRFLGAIHQRGADQRLLDALAQVFWDMGDHPMAGKFWFLTDRDDLRARTSCDAFVERYGGDPERMLRTIAFVRTPEHYPPVAAKRLRALIDATSDQGRPWVPRSERESAPEWGWDRESIERLPVVSRFLVPLAWTTFVVVMAITDDGTESDHYPALLDRLFDVYIVAMVVAILMSAVGSRAALKASVLASALGVGVSTWDRKYDPQQWLAETVGSALLLGFSLLLVVYARWNEKRGAGSVESTA